MMHASAPGGVDVAGIKRQAVLAAATYTCINAACPWPFYSEEGHVFKAAFLQERTRIEAAHQPNQIQPTSTDCQDMTFAKTPPRPYVAPLVAKICNSNTKGFYSTTRDGAVQSMRNGADNALARPSRHGDCLHYRDGRVTTLCGKPITSGA